MIRSYSGEVMVDLEKKSHVYCNLLQFSHYLRLGTRILIFFGAQSFDILIFRFIEYLEHTYWTKMVLYNLRASRGIMLI